MKLRLIIMHHNLACFHSKRDNSIPLQSILKDYVFPSLKIIHKIFMRKKSLRKYIKQYFSFYFLFTA